MVRVDVEGRGEQHHCGEGESDEADPVPRHIVVEEDAHGDDGAQEDEERPHDAVTGHHAVFPLAQVGDFEAKLATSSFS